MALATLYSRAQLGIEAPRVRVEVHLSGGLPSFAIVGLAETAVRESRERVRSALLNAGFEYPQRRITVNLSPADLPKEGGRYDLAIALGILLASNQLKTTHLQQAELYSELGLDGKLHPIRGLFPAAYACAEAGALIIIAPDNSQEASLAGAKQQLSAKTLYDLCQALSAEKLPEIDPQPPVHHPPSYPVDLSEVRGQPMARRALEVAASGMHNLLLSGPPGSGKSMLAQALPSILPPLSQSSCIETASIYSVSGLPVERLFRGERPYRAPHHSASSRAMVGGGSSPRPGEISLAHQGVLFLDELPEFPRSVLEVLREPLETGEVSISRVAGTLTYPARFSLMAAMNPCPCGYYADGTERCQCSQAAIDRYQGRVSGPLLDRFDMRLALSAVPTEELLLGESHEECSDRVRKRVSQCQQRQYDRQGKLNSELTGSEVQKELNASETLSKEFMVIATRLQLSARACHRALRVARTLADMNADQAIANSHIMEALSYRQL
ncbi:YifB family Mg chelatase-like AAA ATPase [Marinobacterium sp. xm-d-564]|uniref:YifB family Mg chelatase-like AAA ATPase n=1 Tax=Marinobacterium sp. xm-d-564 TaxID=2497742 RepID=UPI00156889CA|nr:YifB family Mg chelatase-like AAA ATPase [Marinobacterium sp. xm-d-564]NRP59317.1 Competence protein ComM [Marinobacterium sp. xm-d-564]